MRKYVTAGLVLAAIAVAGLVIAAAPAAAGHTKAAKASKRVTTNDSCADFGQGVRQCSAGTANHDTNFALVQFGRRSAGWYQLTCSYYYGFITRFRQGRVGVNGSRNLQITNVFGFPDQACVLTAQAVGNAPGANAHVRVTLVG